VPSERGVTGAGQRAAALATGGALFGGAILVAVSDPSSANSRFPPCAFHQLTGLWCPGCGLTRGTHHLLHGDLIAALSSNLFTPVVLVTIVVAWWVWTRRAFGKGPGRVIATFQRAYRLTPSVWSRGAQVALVAVVLLFGVARNLPITALTALAP
jgi:hypothetical protein